MVAFGGSPGELAWAGSKPLNPGTDGTASEFPANGAGNPWQSRQSPGGTVAGGGVGTRKGSPLGRKRGGSRGAPSPGGAWGRGRARRWGGSAGVGRGGFRRPTGSTGSPGSVGEG